jgi:hypothetical protein
VQRAPAPQLCRQQQFGPEGGAHAAALLQHHSCGAQQESCIRVAGPSGLHSPQQLQSPITAAGRTSSEGLMATALAPRVCSPLQVMCCWPRLGWDYFGGWQFYVQVSHCALRHAGKGMAWIDCDPLGGIVLSLLESCFCNASNFTTLPVSERGIRDQEPLV